MTETVKSFILLFLSLFGIFYGIFLSYGAMKNTKIFRQMPKRLDLVAFFGDTGRLIYFILGIILFFLGIFLACKALI
jgi:hypothetical protein